MNKTVERLILAGGITSMLWAVFHVVVIPQLVSEMATEAGGRQVAGVSAMADFILLCNACFVAFLFGVGLVLVVGRKTVRQSIVGRMTLMMLTAFWLVRLITPYFLLPQGVTALQNLGVLDVIFVLMVALYLVPLLVRKPAVATTIT
ncbi:MAG: hypothetical protein FWG47_02805 [Propionibacteriaceae bacterium]|nr:hypothetical protein [Propionibacteriaceae bacterium]